MNKEDITKKYVEFQLLNQQIQQAQQQMQLLSQQILELKSLSKNLGELSLIESGSEMYNNLGVGVHIKSTVKDIKHLLVNVGAGILVQKTPEETITIVDKQVSELEKFIVNLEANLHKSIEKAEQLRQEIEKEQQKK